MSNTTDAGDSDERGHVRAVEAELGAVLRWLRVDGIGQGRLRQLTQGFGRASIALGASSVAVAEVLSIDTAVAARMLSDACSDDATAAVAEEMRALGLLGVEPVFEGSGRYPALLAATHDPPAVLFVRGRLEAAPEPAVAIVGSRQATSYGRVQAGRIAGELAERGVTVISGGARGIDAESHRGALRASGRTIAVLATGATNPYPLDHISLFDSIVEAGGCVMTEQPPSVTVRPDLFPRRNRIIAGLSLVTLVVEAASRSGALLTARIAVDDLSREAACLPGPVESPWSEGCHRAIREGWAQLVTGANDVIELLHGARSVAEGAVELAVRRESRPEQAPRREPAEPRRRVVESRREPVPPTSPCSPDAEAVLAAIRAAGRAGLDELEQALDWTVPRLACATLELEVAGRIGRLADGAFAERAR